MDILYKGKSMKTNWELGKELSNYHFDKSIKDTDSFRKVGRFIGDWKDELEEAYKTMASVTWNSRWHKHGKKDPRGNLAENEIKDIIDAGGDPDMTMYQGSYTIGPVMQKMIDALGMDNCRYKLHIQLTGEVVTMHMDKHYELDGGEARRFLIALEDWEPGQFVMFGNQLCERWTAGDIFTWEWKDIPHATANASLHKRPLLAVTGVVTEMTQELIDNPKLRYNLE
ncbi:uncharacterized protein METZ01_LOCUS235846 [marine metagenome]|uniref:Aspartyl/asparaginy/proline hydroxylase domain-containing protein n=1 Tax=marine metagenome TaxID=408172 RepID=A0A382H712_9ZZZZ